MGQDMYMDEVLQTLEGSRETSHSYLFKYAMPILLSKQNCKGQYYSDRQGFMETLFKSMTDLLFSDFSDENPGTKERFLDFLGKCEFSRDVLTQVDRSVSKELIGYFSDENMACSKKKR